MFPLFCHQQLLNSFPSPVCAVYSQAGPTGIWCLTTELMSVEEPEHASAEAPKILEVLSPAQGICRHYSNAPFNGSLAEQTKLKS